MARKRYVQVGLELVETTQNPGPALPTDAGVLWGDRSYDGSRTVDGVDISTRTKHREYMKARGLTHPSDFKNEWVQARAQRDDFFTTGGDHKARREIVERALHEAINGRNR
jgi:hypothetical protein